MGMTRILAIAAVTAGLSACASGMKPVHQAQVGNTRVTLSTASGTLSSGNNDLTLSFADADGKPVEVQSPMLRFTMPGLHTQAAISAMPALAPAGRPGEFKGTVGLQIKGIWQATVDFQDPAGPHTTTFDIEAR